MGQCKACVCTRGPDLAILSEQASRQSAAHVEEHVSFSLRSCPADISSDAGQMNTSADGELTSQSHERRKELTSHSHEPQKELTSQSHEPLLSSSCGCCSFLNRRRRPKSRDVQVSSDATVPFVAPQIVSGSALAPQKPAAAAPEQMVHPDFSGTWKTVKAEGEMNEFFKDLGAGFVARSLGAALGWGVGRQKRTYEQIDTHMKLIEFGLANSEIEFDIIGEEQLIKAVMRIPSLSTKIQTASYMMTSYWDKENPQVLRCEGQDEKKKKWTNNSRQFFINTDSLVIESISKHGHLVRWIYQRDSGT